jgi:hypothetical protein
MSDMTMFLYLYVYAYVYGAMRVCESGCILCVCTSLCVLRGGGQLVIVEVCM